MDRKPNRFVKGERLTSKSFAADPPKKQHHSDRCKQSGKHLKDKISAKPTKIRTCLSGYTTWLLHTFRAIRSQLFATSSSTLTLSAGCDSDLNLTADMAAIPEI
jgi:hypothetical protein